MVRSFMNHIIDFLKMATIQHVAHHLKISWDMVKEIHKERLKLSYKKVAYRQLKYLSIDEISLHKGHEYMTIVTDIRSGRIIHAIEGRDKEALLPFLQKLARYAVNLQAIAIDMSASYHAAIVETLPQVEPVFDHFHVTALINKALDEVRKEQIRKNPQHVTKGSKYLLLKNYDHLTLYQRQSLNMLMKINQPIAQGYALKEQFRLFWQKETKKDAAKFFLYWLIDVFRLGIRPLVKVGKTLLRYWNGLLNYFTHRITNGKAEGINNKIKTLKRQTYVFRDLEYFKLRLYHLHRQRYSLTG